VCRWNLDSLELLGTTLVYEGVEADVCCFFKGGDCFATAGEEGKYELIFFLEAEGYVTIRLYQLKAVSWC
jgi:hypothetical protein